MISSMLRLKAAGSQAYRVLPGCICRTPPSFSLVCLDLSVISETDEFLGMSSSQFTGWQERLHDRNKNRGLNLLPPSGEEGRGKLPLLVDFHRFEANCPTLARFPPVA